MLKARHLEEDMGPVLTLLVVCGHKPSLRKHSDQIRFV